MLQRSAFDESTVLARLPPKHRKHLLCQLYRTQVVTCPLFGSMLDERIIARLCSKLQPYLAAKGDVIIQEGEHGSEMYMIFGGAMIIHSKTLAKMDKKTWVDGAFFGELPMLQVAALVPGGVIKSNSITLIHPGPICSSGPACTTTATSTRSRRRRTRT